LARRQLGGVRLDGVRLEVCEDPLGHDQILDASDDSHCPATGRAGLDTDTDDPFQALRPYALWVQVIEARRSAGVGCSQSSLAVRGPPVRQLAGVIRARCSLFGAKTS
jgi:hypothetical protein